MPHERQLFVSPQSTSPASTSQAGFTLIELVIGIVVFAVALTMLTSLIYPLAQKSVDPIYQLRATELANALINEIQGKAFDENSNPSLGLGRCDDGANSCTLPDDMGPDTESRDLFDDVDDYHGLTISGQHLSNDQSYQDLYKNYQLDVSVFYDGDYNGTKDLDITSRSVKLVKIAVTTPAAETIEFAVYRSNY